MIMKTNKDSVPAPEDLSVLKKVRLLLVMSLSVALMVLSLQKFENKLNLLSRLTVEYSDPGISFVLVRRTFGDIEIEVL